MKFWKRYECRTCKDTGWRPGYRSGTLMACSAPCRDCEKGKAAQTRWAEGVREHMAKIKPLDIPRAPRHALEVEQARLARAQAEALELDNAARRAGGHMRAAWYGRARLRTPQVTLAMSLGEFREHVEWLERMAPGDGCTREWREELDRLDPLRVDEDEYAS